MDQIAHLHEHKKNLASDTHLCQEKNFQFELKASTYKNCFILSISYVVDVLRTHKSGYYTTEHNSQPALISYVVVLAVTRTTPR